MSQKEYSLLVHGASQIVQVAASGERVITGSDMKEIAILEQKDGQGLSIVADRDGKIAALGYDDEIKSKFTNCQFDTVIDAKGRCILPGLVDGHTHAVWAGDRVHEFAMKLAGATYLEVHEAGGGIHYTVDHVHKASEEELYEDFREVAMRMLMAGTTLMECKSGYGLDAENELKMLRVIDRGIRELPIDISSTYCAHAVPKDKRAEEATKDILGVQLPLIKKEMDAGRLTVHNVDVFCEKGVFDVKQSRRILEAGKAMGLNINFHGEELHKLNSAEMGAEIGALTISHLEEVSDAGMRAMAKSGTMATILPTTAYILRLRPPPVRRMIGSCIPIALGSDFNPNAHCFSMPVVMNLACVLLNISMSEALVAATLNAAASLARSDRQGSLEVGKLADMLILDAPRWEHLVYQLGNHSHVISYVIKNGCVVHSKQESSQSPKAPPRKSKAAVQN